MTSQSGGGADERIQGWTRTKVNFFGYLSAFNYNGVILNLFIASLNACILHHGAALWLSVIFSWPMPSSHLQKGFISEAERLELCSRCLSNPPTAPREITFEGCPARVSRPSFNFSTQA